MRCSFRNPLNDFLASLLFAAVLFAAFSLLGG